MAIEKATQVAGDTAGHWILAADTVVALGRRVLGKAATVDEARRFLMLLSGRRHRVIGGIALIAPDGRQARRTVQTVVSFKRLHASDLDWYVESDEWRDKAGAYAIQGRAAVFVRSISGSYSNVVGLSLSDVWSMFQGLGWRPGP